MFPCGWQCQMEVQVENILLQHWNLFLPYNTTVIFSFKLPPCTENLGLHTSVFIEIQSAKRQHCVQGSGGEFWDQARWSASACALKAIRRNIKPPSLSRPQRDYLCERAAACELHMRMYDEPSARIPGDPESLQFTGGVRFNGPLFRFVLSIGRRSDS